MEGDEGDLSSLNTEEKLDFEDSGNAGESNPIGAGGVYLEAVTTGGELGIVESHVEVGSAFTNEAVAEMFESRAVVPVETEEVEGVSEEVDAVVGESEIETEGEEGVGEDGEMSVSFVRDVEFVSESQVDDARQDIIVDYPKMDIEADEESSPVINSQLEEEVVLDLDKDSSFSGLPTNDGSSELLASGVVMESGNDESKGGMQEKNCRGERIEEMAVAGIDLVDTWTMENDLEMVMDNADGEEKVEFVVNYSETEAVEKFSSMAEEKLNQVITEETPVTEVEIEMNLVAEVATNILIAAVDDQSRESVADGGDKLTENNEVVSEVGFIPEKEIGENEDMKRENGKDFKLDEPLNVAENKDGAVIYESLQSGNVEEEGVETDLTKNVAGEELELEDTEVETGIESEVAADKTTGEDTIMETEETNSVKDADHEMDDSSAAHQDEIDEKTEMTGTQETEIESETELTESGKASGGKRKRGKISKISSISKSTAKSASRKTVGEDVCFICFDGGELVLCDRRGCPKAYHPSCVNRDEAFFKAKGRWNCGWHMCSICEKNATFMCYTCTFSLCKSCSKDMSFFCVRGNKGFCETCMRTVLLIEKNEHGNEENQVDFDDRGSWEYLFKDYYIELKSKLALSTVEVAEAKRPWKGAASILFDPSKQEYSEAQPYMNDGGSCSEDNMEDWNNVKPKRRKLKKQIKSVAREKELSIAGVAPGDKILSFYDNSEWASKELLEFVAHMKNGETSILSQFDVQSLLLEYIKRNKLRDPRRKSQIICDTRLEILFGKPRVGHFEMLKLLESHFLVRDEKNEDVQEIIVDNENNQLDVDDHDLTKGIKDRKRKTRKKGVRGPQSNLDDYAAIDMHNISLIYLRRKLMEDLLDDVENFHDKVVGMFVRIRISGSLQKQDLYRLVQVVGTNKAAESYKIGKKNTDTMVEILNLDKTEVISIDTISNQEFTEEECKRLRQSIKCGLISRLTVGEILDKTMETQATRVDDWLEAEIVRLTHLRDRASDIGKRKELRECVEKLQILKTPEERQRRLQEIPEIHSDPKMDPSYESDENDRETEDCRRDDFMKSRGSGFSRRGRGSIFSEGDNSVKDSWVSAGKFSSKNWEFSRNMSGNSFSSNTTVSGDENILNSESERHAQESNIEKLTSTHSESADMGRTAASRAELLSAVSSVASQSSLPTGVVETSVKINETEKIWHYKDPSGKVQGPFSLGQLRKWSNTGYFPADLKVWKALDTQDDSVLISDALAGKYQKDLPAVKNIVPATDILHSPSLLAGLSGQTSGTSLHQDKEKPIVNRNPQYHTNLSSEKWTSNAVINLPSPTPKQSNLRWIGGDAGERKALLAGVIQSSGIKGVLSSPTAASPNIETQSLPPHASVLNSLVQSSASFSPTSKSQPGIPVSSADSLHSQPTVTGEPQIQMHSYPSTTVQPVQHVINPNPPTETQVWGTNAQSLRPQSYGWAAPNNQNSAASALQPEFWRSTQGSQPNIYPPTAPNMNWGVAPSPTPAPAPSPAPAPTASPAENSTPLGVRPENHNTVWGTMHAIPNMGFGNPAVGNASMNQGPPMLAAPRGNTNSSWPASSGNLVANTQGPMPGNATSGWATSGWVPPPVQGPIPGNEWGPMNGTARAPAPVQGSAQGPANQVWGALQGNHGGPWPGKQNQSGGPFPGQTNGQGRDSGFGGGRPWNNQSSFGGGAPGGYRPLKKRETLCPYNANGRCRKGAQCDYIHT